MLERPHTPAAAPALAPAADPKAPAQKPWLGRLVRLSVCASAFALLGWWVVVPFLFPITSRAVVNARVVQARSPIDGVNAAMEGDVGDEVAEGQPLLRVANGRVDTSHLAELKGRVKGLEARRAGLERELEVAEAEAPVLRATVKRYQKAVLECLAAADQEATARVAAASVELEGAQQRERRLQRLRAKNGISTAELEDVEEGAARSRKNLEKEQAVKTRLSGEFAAAKQGVFLQNEASYSQRRADELEQKIAALKGSLKENADLLLAGRTHLREEEARVEGLKEVAVTSPVAGTVWKRPGNVGQVVKQNELVFEVADRKTVFVEALFHQRFLAGRLAPGARAVVNLTSGQRLGGRVQAVRTLGEAGEEPSYAVKLCGSDARQVHVLIALDDAGHDTALIGRHVRVLVVGEDPGAFERAVAWMFSKVWG